MLTVGGPVVELLPTVDAGLTALAHAPIYFGGQRAGGRSGNDDGNHRCRDDRAMRGGDLRPTSELSEEGISKDVRTATACGTQ